MRRWLWPSSLLRYCCWWCLAVGLHRAGQTIFRRNSSSYARGLSILGYLWIRCIQHTLSRALLRLIRRKQVRSAFIKCIPSWAVYCSVLGAPCTLCSPPHPLSLLVLRDLVLLLFFSSMHPLNSIVHRCPVVVPSIPGVTTPV